LKTASLVTSGGRPNSQLNGPQGAIAFDLEDIDSHAGVIPAAPSVASAQAGTEESGTLLGGFVA